jgi:hypothetical protein
MYVHEEKGSSAKSPVIWISVRKKLRILEYLIFSRKVSSKLFTRKIFLRLVFLAKINTTVHLVGRNFSSNFFERSSGHV